MQHITIVLVVDACCNIYWTSVLSNCANLFPLQGKQCCLFGTGKLPAVAKVLVLFSPASTLYTIAKCVAAPVKHVVVTIAVQLIIG